MNALRAGTIAALAALALAALGCGEKSEPPTTGPVITQTTGTDTRADEQAVRTAAIAFLVSPDAVAICDQGITARLLQQGYGDRKRCLSTRKPRTLAENVTIGSLQLGEAGGATVIATARGGDYGKGEKVTMRLVRDAAGLWRVDAVKTQAPIFR